MKYDTIPKIILTVALSIGIALFAYSLLVPFMVDDIPQNEPQYKRVNNLLNFYEQPHDGDIFVLGSSYITEGVDAYVVEELLQQRFINISAYNLGIHNSSPIERVGEVDYIIASKPKIVVIGVSYVNFGDSSYTFWDHIVLPYQRKQINIEEIRSLFTNEQLKKITQSPIEFNIYRFFDKRKYIFDSISTRVRNIFILNESCSINKPRFPDSYVTNFKDPWFMTSNVTEAEKRDMAMAWNKKVPQVSEDLNPQKRALLYTINRLKNDNISVIILNMPINPLASEMINESSRNNLSNFLNTTGVPWYDYEREYPSEYFIDMVHMNVAGRTEFSPKVAKIIADNLIKGA